MGDALLELRDVRAGYGEAVVLDGVSIALPDNGSLAVLGRNGVGKTTLLLAVMGFVRLMRGSIMVAGRDVSRLSPHKRAQHGPRLGAAGARDIPFAERRGEPPPWPRGPAAGTSARSSSCSRGSRSGATTWVTSFRAASSRCWRSPARS